MAFGNELTEQQYAAIELLARGETITKTAEIIGVNRKTVGEWKKQEAFKAELDRQVTTLKNVVEGKILKNVEPLMDRLINIALKSKSDKTALDAIIYALNRLCGLPTSKVEDISRKLEEKKDLSWDDLKTVANELKVVDINKNKS